MKFRIYTLVDVTETRAARGTDPFLMQQQQNFNTLYNCVGLRTNPTDFIVTSEKTSLSKFNFGSSFKNSQKVWTVDFTVEAEESTNVDFMQSDFNLVPFISNLNETVKFKDNIFITSRNDSLCNIIFNRIDK